MTHYVLKYLFSFVLVSREHHYVRSMGLNALGYLSHLLYCNNDILLTVISLMSNGRIFPSLPPVIAICKFSTLTPRQPL